MGTIYTFQKSFSSKRRWRTNESTEAIGEHDDNEETHIELQQSCPTNETRTLSVFNSNTDNQATELGFGNNRSATVTTSNIVVGSISIEAPPAYLQTETLSETNSMTELRKQLNHPLKKTQNTTTSASHDSTDTVEELVLVPNETKSRSLEHQRSSTSTNRSQSPTISLHNSSMSLSLKGVKHKINSLPMVSVSGPSPLQEEVPASECL